MANHAKRGDLLAQLTPFVVSLKKEQLPRLCSHCLREGKLLTCTSCKVMRYCNATCQRRDWKYHKVECKCFLNDAVANLLLQKEQYRICIRLIIRRNKGETKLKCDEMKLRCFDDLMSHSKEIRNDPDAMNDFEILYSDLQTITEGILKVPGHDEMLEIFGKKCINSFGVSTQVGDVDGPAVYLSSSVFDHSCDPDVVISYCNNVQQIRAIRDFTYDKFSDIKITYTNILAPIDERQKSLRWYYFTCQCSSCVGLESDSMEQLMTSSKCPTGGCTSPVLENVDGSFAACKECGNEEYPKDYAECKNKAMFACKDALEELDSFDFSNEADVGDAYTLLTEVLTSVLKILHPSNIYLFRMLDKASRICSMHRTDGKTQEALKYGRLKIESLKLLPPSDVHRCMYHKEVGHLEFALGHYSEALEAFMTVGDAVKMMYGENHTLTLDLQESILETRLMLAKLQSSNRSEGAARVPRNT